MDNSSIVAAKIQMETIQKEIEKLKQQKSRLNLNPQMKNPNLIKHYNQMLLCIVCGSILFFGLFIVGAAITNINKIMGILFMCLGPLVAIVAGIYFIKIYFRIQEFVPDIKTGEQNEITECKLRKKIEQLQNKYNNLHFQILNREP